MRCVNYSVARPATPADALAMKQGCLTMRALVLMVFLLGSVAAQIRPTLAQGIEIEPNDPCLAAQDVGAATLPFTMAGNLGSTMEVPDVDFFKFSGVPGSVVEVDLEGAATGKGTLVDPYLGFFDAGCTLVAANDDSGSLNSRLVFIIPADGVFILAATLCCDGGFVGGGVGTYEMTVARFAAIGLISGRIVDAVTAAPLPGNTEPFGFVRLLRCTDPGCSDVNQQPADPEGRFQFDRDFAGQLLEAGTYQVLAFANEYQQGQTDPFAVAEGEERDVGDVPLEPFPVRVTSVDPCGNVPPEGGRCQYSVRIRNRSGTRLDGSAWSLVQGFGLGSFADVTDFQAGVRQFVLRSQEFKRVDFEFRVPSKVRVGASICARLYVGRRPDAVFDTLASAQLFCITKEAVGFVVMADKTGQQLFRQISGRTLTPPK